MAYDTFDNEKSAIPLPKPAGLHSKHPLRNDESHRQLLNYCQKRLNAGKQARDSRLNRMVKIDKNVAGWIKHSDEDRERLREKDRTGIPQAVKVNLPLTFVHLDDMMTYFVQTFAPSRGMFYHTGSPTDATPAQQMVTLMNNHAIYGGYYREVVKTVFSILKYNQGGFSNAWSSDYGPKLSTDSTNKPIITEEIVWQGNKIESLDMYNTFWDPHVNAIDCYKDGEWCAEVKMRSRYWLQSRAAKGLFFNLDDILDNDNDNGTQSCYYRNPPAEAKLTNVEESASDWVAILSETDEYMRGTGYEIVTQYIRLNPIQCNLIPNTAENRASRNRFEIWRITICNDKQIIDCTYMNNIHGMLPFFIGVVKDDSMGTAQKSTAEVLQPLQDFASFLLNAHVESTRKNLYGVTIYDPTVVDLNAIPKGEVAARIPVKASGYGKDLRTAIYKESGVLDTEQTLQDLQKVMDLINQFFPTQSLPSQIAGIDRAIDSQVAAVQQGTNRRNQKDARVIDDTLFRPLRFALYYNIIQFQPDNSTVDDFYGKSVTIDLSVLRTTDLPFIIGQGLKAIDMQAAATKLQQIIFALIQNPQAAQQINLLGLIDYWTSLIDIDVDMTQFHIQQAAPQGQVGPDGQPIAGAAPTPIVNPLAATGPLTKPGVQAPAATGNAGTQ